MTAELWMEIVPASAMTGAEDVSSLCRVLGARKVRTKGQRNEACHRLVVQTGVGDEQSPWNASLSRQRTLAKGDI